MPRYEYAPINSEASEIRLLTVLPGEFTDEIRITLHTTILTKDSVPEYEALSYAWGSMESKPKITILNYGEKAHAVASDLHTIRTANSVSELSLSSEIEVTQNLAEAILYLRFKEEERVMWIDAICVNQQDLVERSKQVQRMADVFNLAKRVVVWLGPEGEDSRYAMPLFAKIASHVEFNFETLEVKASHQASGVDLYWSNMSEEWPLNQTQSAHLAQFLERKWFQRLWIWQEIHLSKDGAVLMCGREILEWKIYQVAVGCISAGMIMFRRSFTVQRDLLIPVAKASYLCQPGRAIPFGLLMIVTQFQECSDPRDRVFALLSLMSEKFLVQPDYTKSVSEVYQYFTTAFISSSSNLSLLQFCVMREPTTLELPTWVPDFAQHTPTKHYDDSPIETAANDLQFSGGGILSLLGVRLSRIESVQQVEFCGRADMLPVLRRLAPLSLATAEGAYVADNTTFDSFYRLIAGSLVPSIPASPLESSWNNGCAAMLRALYYPHEPSHVPDTVLTQIRGHLDARAFLTTVDGHAATGPESTKPGDEIVYILGCARPFLLRYAEDGCKIVGLCHIEGFMLNEGILGALSEHITIVNRWDEASQRYYRAWRDEATGELLIRDPRWGPLPAGWSVKHHGLEHAVVLFENLETGEGTEKYVNPFLKLESLRERGVELERFNLR